MATATARAANTAPNTEPISDAVFSPFPCGDFCETADAVALGPEGEAVSFGRAVDEAESTLFDVILEAEVGTELITTSRPGKLSRAACAETVTSPSVTHPHWTVSPPL